MNPNSHTRPVAGAVILALVLCTSGVALAAPSVAQKLETCRNEAQAAYGSADRDVRLRLDDIRKSGRELRVFVVTGDGEGFRAVCEVDRRSGELVSLSPPQSPARETLPKMAGEN